MTLENIISVISESDKITITNDMGAVAFHGICSEFKTTALNEKNFLIRTISRVYSYNCVTVIVLA